MKDARTNIKVLTYIAIVSILGMVAWGAVSWSQNHTFALDFLLYATLGAIFAIFLILSFTHPKKDTGAIKLSFAGIEWIRFRHLFRTTGYLFFGVIVFGVNSDFHWVETAHLIATGLAIFFAYLTLLRYYKSKVGRGLAIIGAIFGIGGFLGSWFFDYEIKDGEAIAATPLIIWIFIVLKNWKK